MKRSARQQSLDYVIALSAMAAALLIRWPLYPLLEGRRPYLTLFGGVALAVWISRWKPATLAAMVGFLAANYFFASPENLLGLNAFFVTEFVFYALSVGLIIFTGESLHRARDRIEHEAAERRTAEESERRQQELHRVTLASIGDAVISTDNEGRITFLNAVAESLTGWSRSDAAGQPLDTVFRIVNERTRRPVENPATRALREGNIVGLANHTILLARDGVERPIDDSAAPIVDGQGQVAGCVLVFRDVTEPRKAERSARFLAAIVESSDDAIIGKDASGTITSWNRAAERLYGYSAAEAIGQPVAILAPPDRADEMPAILARIKQGERIEHFDTVRRAKDGRLVPISLTISPIIDETGEIVGASKIARDISERKRAEEALREEKARLHTTLVGIGDAVIVTDAESRVTLMNPVAQALTGWKDEALGRPLEEVFRIVNEQTREPVESPVRKVIREGTVVGLANQTVLIGKDGTERPIDDSAAPIRDPNGQIVAVVMVFRDVSARRQIEKEREQLQAELAARVHELQTIFDIAPVQIWFGDAECKRFHGNRRAYEEHGLDYGINASFDAPERELPEGLRIVAQGRDLRPEEMPMQVAARTGKPVRGFEHEVVHSDGRRIYMLANVAPLLNPNGTVRGVVGCYVDISERKKAEEELKAADRHKNEFLATLAHELRNPLAPVHNSLQIMRRVGSDPEAVERALGTMERQVGQMVRLIDDLLDVTRISRGKIELRKERVELASVVHQAVEICRPFAQNLQHEVSVTLPADAIYLHADPARLAQVFSNLLNNACKYTKRGGRIWLTAQRQGSDVLLSVKDSGIGIPPDMLRRVFDLFTQVDQSLQRSHGGLGIGLTVVKQLVEMHDGKVEAFSRGTGLGSEFIVRLPLLVEHQ